MTDLESEILSFERHWPMQSGSKARAVHELFGMSPNRYSRVLTALLDDPAAYAADPLLVRRLRLRRSQRAAGTRQSGPLVG